MGLKYNSLCCGVGLFIFYACVLCALSPTTSSTPPPHVWGGINNLFNTTPSCVGVPSTTSSTLPPPVWGGPQRQPLQHYPNTAVFLNTTITEDFYLTHNNADNKFVLHTALPQHMLPTPSPNKPSIETGFVERAGGTSSSGSDNSNNNNSYSWTTSPTKQTDLNNNNNILF